MCHHRSTARSAAVSLLFLAASACTGSTSEPKGGTTGSATVNIELAADIIIDWVDWEVTGGNMEPMSGRIDTSAPGATASVEVFGLPEGDDYTIEMTAVSIDQQTTCKGSANFPIAVGQVTDVMVILSCQRQPSFGAVRANGKINVCAQLTKVIVSPLTTSVGATIDLLSAAEDAEGDNVAYAWTATAGNFGDPAAPVTTYTCDVEGSQSIRITVSDDDFQLCNDDWTVPVVCGAPSAGNILQILHSSDNESSFQDPNTLEEKILNYAAITAGLQTLAEQEGYESVFLTIGDHTIPGPFYQASSEVDGLGQPGLGDIVNYNAMLLEANGMGNHEFDGGIDEFAQMLVTAAYPFLAVNLDFSNVVLEPGTPDIEIGVDGSDCAENAAKVLKSCVLTVGQDQIGLIGRAPADFFNVIEDPPVTIPGLDFFGGRDENNQPLVSAVTQVLEQVDLLEAQGINRIFLLDHAQDFTGDPLSAQNLRGIDVIAAAGSTGFMAKPLPDGPFNLLRPEDTPEANYPTVRVDMDGHPVLVINSDQQYRYVGMLIVQWDVDGRIFSVDPRSGPIATTAAGISALEEVVGESVEAPQEIQDVFADLQATPLITSSFTQVGETISPLNGMRAEVRSRETNLGRVAANSTLWFARQDAPDLEIDVALKNGGGIRDSITGPAIIRLSIEAALAFDNTLSILELTGAQLIAAMENSVSRVPALDGRFPQVAGMVLEYDQTQPPLEAQESVMVPSRIASLVITLADGTTDTLVDNFVAQGDLARTFVVATNSFQATGGDGYAAFAAAIELDITDIGEQQILEEYIVDELGGVVDVMDPPPSPRVIPLSP